MPLNYLAIFIAALTAFILGFLFHGPILGKLWMKLADIHPTGNEKFSDMIPKLIWNFITNLGTATGLAIIALLTSGSTYLSLSATTRGAELGALAWAGFLLTSSAIEVIWMGRKPSLWIFEASISLIVMICMGMIVTTMSV